MHVHVGKHCVDTYTVGTSIVLTNGGIVDVVVSCNHAEVEGREVHLLLDGHTL